MNTLKVKTTLPDQRPSFTEWCKMFNVSKMYVDRTPIQNANRIMSLWDGYLNTKELFIKTDNLIPSL